MFMLLFVTFQLHFLTNYIRTISTNRLNNHKLIIGNLLENHFTTGFTARSPESLKFFLNISPPLFFLLLKIEQRSTKKQATLH